MPLVSRPPVSRLPLSRLPAPAAARHRQVRLYSRPHVDLQRVSSALCCS